MTKNLEVIVWKIFVCPINFQEFSNIILNFRYIFIKTYILHRIYCDYTFICKSIWKMDVQETLKFWYCQDFFSKLLWTFFVRNISRNVIRSSFFITKLLGLGVFIDFFQKLSMLFLKFEGKLSMVYLMSNCNDLGITLLRMNSSQFHCGSQSFLLNFTKKKYE